MCFSEYDYIDETKMDDICMLKSLPPVIPRRAIHKGGVPQTSGFSRSQESKWNLQDKYISDSITQRTHALSSQTQRQGNFGNCSGGEHHAASNQTTSVTRNIGVKLYKLDRQYEKPNKETMEPQFGHTQFKEYSGMDEFPGQFYSGIPMLNSQSVQYMDMICQRMTTIAMQQFDSWVKEKYMITNFSSTDENEVLQYQYNSDRANRYPVGMGGGLRHQGVSGNKKQFRGREGGSCLGMETSGILQKYNVHKMFNSRLRGADTFDNPCCAEQQHPTSGIESQLDSTDVLGKSNYNHSFELRGETAHDMKSNRAAEIPEQCFVLPDIGVNMYKISDFHLLPSVDSDTLALPHHEPETGVDSFG